MAITLKPKGGASLKIEVFEGRLFSARSATDLLGAPLSRAEAGKMVRLRVNGRWFPAKTVTLYSREQLHSLLAKFSNQGFQNG